MRKKLLIVLTLAIVCIMAFAGCSAPTLGTYNLVLVDLEEGVIKTGGVGANEVKFTFNDDFWNNEANAEYASYKDMFTHKTIVDIPTSNAGTNNQNQNEYYLGHPDSILLKRKAAGTDTFTFGEVGEILTMYPLGHGKGALYGKYSMDGGMTYTEAMKPYNPAAKTPEENKGATPKSWNKSQETPTLYRLIFNENNVPSDDDAIILISGNPYWGGTDLKANGFNVSMSFPSVAANGDTVEGREWTEFETWYGNGKTPIEGATIREPQGYMKAYDAIVAMSSLTRLKKYDAETKTTTGWDNKWMGLFHDHNFNCYKTILEFKSVDELVNAMPQDTTNEAKDAYRAELAKYPTYNIQGTEKIMMWSTPEKYFDSYRKIERKSQMCEVECLRSDGGNGDKLAIITRSNSKQMNSLISFSEDEGATWSAPRELPAAINGERHKAEWIKVTENGVKVDKLFITFRSIERGTDKVAKYSEGMSWMSEGYVAWVGDWDDLEKGTEGDFRVKLAHTYLAGQTAPQRGANGDTGYCGNVVLPSGKVATCSYGRFSPDNDAVNGKKTYIVGKVVDVEGLYKLVALAK